MNNKQGFHMIEALNNENTHIALVWHNTRDDENGYGNYTVSKEVIDVIKIPEVVGKYLTRIDFEEIGKRLMNDNNITECAISFETV